MNLENIEYLKSQLSALGFPYRTVEQVNEYTECGKVDFHIFYSNQIDEDHLMYDLHFTKSSENTYQLTNYELTYKQLNIPDLTIDGINTKDLDNKLKEVNGWYDKYFETDGTQNSMSKNEYEATISFIKETNKELRSLAEIEEGKEAAKLLMYKYLPESEYEKYFSDFNEMQKQYEYKHIFFVNGYKPLTVTDAYQWLKVSSERLSKTVTYEIPKPTFTGKKLNQTILFKSKTNFMNEKNFDYLKDQIKFTGFGEGLENDLKDKMQKQTSEFQVAHQTKFGNDDLSAVLHFKKSDETDMYFFNRYQVILKPEHSSETMEQTFYINKGNNVTLKEAYNLMNGRAVNKDLTNKEGEVYNAWIQMDFKQTDNNGNYKMKQFHQNYGYELDSILTKHPIKELSNDQDKSRLVESLQKGNRQSVTFIQGGGEQKQFIEANPQFKTINIFDSNMQRINHKQGQSEKQGQGEQSNVTQKSKAESQRQGDADDGDTVPKASNKRKKKQTHSIS